MEAENVRIVIADDHPIFRAGLRSVLEAEPGFLVVGEAGDGDEAVRLTLSLRPDVLLLDLAMPGVSGMDALSELAAASGPVRTIVLTAAIEREDIVKALQLGAAGVVLKASVSQMLVKAIRSVMGGQHWIGRESVSDLVHALRGLMAASPAKASPERFGVTPRELEITSAVVAGFSNKEIAKKFSLSQDTVKHHLTNIFDKVGASNRLELALFAVHHRLLEDEPATPAGDRMKKVLLVDDDPDVGALVSRALGEAEGYTVQVCGSSIDALESARAFRPDLILLDVMMPGIDGPETLKALRANETTASIPVIFMSAGADRHAAPQYQKLGAMGVIPKPFDPALLPATLRGICSGQPINEQAHPRDFDDLRGTYLSELPEKTDAMAALAAALFAGGWHKPTVESLVHMAHRLAGSSALYGVDGLARAAGILEEMLKRLLQAPRWPPSRPPDDAATLVKALARCVPGVKARAAHRSERRRSR